ncbi:MAG TPA: SpoIIE family protein phosphatase [Candidatus Binatia bacterium]|nr:SpoIIE family protein phosphatase [Candidatus Binatia bacterium]
MAIGETAYLNSIREQLLAGRARLADVLAASQRQHVEHLLNEVDQALLRIEQGSFGICEECHTDIGEEWLKENPLTTVCLEHMTAKQQRALEYDLELAAQIQKGLLPASGFSSPGWDICYHYRPAGAVGGDYCDLVNGSNGELYFVMADVSGKGVAAAMLSSNLRAVFRSLVPAGLSTAELMRRANRLFRQSALPAQYATMVCGKATPDGALEMVNAGHVPVLQVGESGVKVLEAADPPLGLFEDQEFTAATTVAHRGDTLVLYTDGVLEAENADGNEYGLERLRQLIEQHPRVRPLELVEACREQLQQFRGARERLDDETLLALQYAPAAGNERSPGAVV